MSCGHITQIYINVELFSKIHKPLKPNLIWLKQQSLDKQSTLIKLLAHFSQPRTSYFQQNPPIPVQSGPSIYITNIILWVILHLLRRGWAGVQFGGLLSISFVTYRLSSLARFDWINWLRLSYYEGLFYGELF